MFDALPEGHRRVHQDAFNAMRYGASIAGPRSLTMEEIERGMREVKGFVPYTGRPEFVQELLAQGGKECGSKGGCWSTERDPLHVTMEYRPEEGFFRQEFRLGGPVEREFAGDALAGGGCGCTQAQSSTEVREAAQKVCTGSLDANATPGTITCTPRGKAINKGCECTTTCTGGKCGCWEAHYEAEWTGKPTGTSMGYTQCYNYGEPDNHSGWNGVVECTPVGDSCGCTFHCVNGSKATITKENTENSGCDDSALRSLESRTYPIEGEWPCDSFAELRGTEIHDCGPSLAVLLSRGYDERPCNEMPSEVRETIPPDSSAAEKTYCLVLKALPCSVYAVMRSSAGCPGFFLECCPGVSPGLGALRCERVG